MPKKQVRSLPSGWDRNRTHRSFRGHPLPKYILISGISIAFLYGELCLSYGDEKHRPALNICSGSCRWSSIHGNAMSLWTLVLTVEKEELH